MTGPAETPFADLDHFLELRRASGLTLSPDGRRLVVSVAALDEKRTGFRSSLWEVDPAGEHPARRLTWGPKSESAPVFAPDGSLIFSSARPDPAAAADDDAPAALWVLPAGGGEARPLVARSGGIGAVAVAREAGTLVLSGPALPSAGTEAEDAARRQARKDGKVTAVLHESYPIRFWDHDIGPESDRLFLADPADPADPNEPAGLADRPVLRDLTGHIGAALYGDAGWDVSPDGRQIVSSWLTPEPHGSARYTLVLIDVATGERRELLTDPRFDHSAPVFSPDGRKVALVMELRSAPGEPVDQRVAVLHLDSGELHRAALDWDRWASGAPTWTPDGSALLVVADDNGRAPIWRLDLTARTATRLTSDDAAYSNLQLSADGAVLYALRASIASPPAPVRLDPTDTGQVPAALLGPVEAPAVPGTVTELSTRAADGTTVRAWLVLPAQADAEHPAPLLLWIHGGPLSSWNSWSWRWNPWLAAARGYAVLLPDPALSTGYGLAAIRRGWGRWGAESYTDTMAITDAAVARDDIDADRTAAMGGSYGGFMANWIAGHTDRFRGIVSHAGLWSLEQFGPTTDAYFYWRREMSPQMAADNSPHRFVDRVRTPMLVIHGERDFRVPIGEALRLWAELAEHNDGSIAHRLLIFPDENHWILKPQNAKLWYQTVFAFLGQTVHGEPWQAPDLLR